MLGQVAITVSRWLRTAAQRLAERIAAKSMQLGIAVTDVRPSHRLEAILSGSARIHCAPFSQVRLR